MGDKIEETSTNITIESGIGSAFLGLCVLAFFAMTATCFTAIAVRIAVSTWRFITNEGA